MAYYFGRDLQKARGAPVGLIHTSWGGSPAEVWMSEKVLSANPAAVGDYRAGKPQAVGFLVGQVMKATRGQANAGVVQAALRERLDRPAGDA